MASNPPPPNSPANPQATVSITGTVAASSVQLWTGSNGLNINTPYGGVIEIGDTCTRCGAIIDARFTEIHEARCLDVETQAELLAERILDLRRIHRDTGPETTQSG